MGFNTEVHKALDADSALQRRFGALRSAVQRFSPNGFNATFKNLELAVGVSDPDNWTEEQIEQAVELLRESRIRYMDHRATWDEGRRTHKAHGLREPSIEELGAFERMTSLQPLSGTISKATFEERWSGSRQHSTTRRARCWRTTRPFPRCSSLRT